MNEKLARTDLADPLDHQFLPFGAAEVSSWPDRTGLKAARYLGLHDATVDRPPLTHHTLILFTKTPTSMEMRFAGLRRHAPPPVGWVSLIPAGRPSWGCWRGSQDALHVFLEPALVSRVAADVFGLDPARFEVPALDGLPLPHLRNAIHAVGNELQADAGGCLAAESLANLMAVHLIRHVSQPRAASRDRDLPLSPAKLRAVLEYIEDQLVASLTLGQIAAAVHCSPYHFARQFKAAVGVPPHQYVISRRIERARELLKAGELPLAEVAAYVGFSDQSQLTRHFKRILGVTPGKFRKSARSA